MARDAFVVLASAVIVASIACTREQDVALLGGDAGPADTGALDVHVPSKCPAGMIDVGVLCIDATEVKRGAYAAFLATPPPTPSGACTWKSASDYRPKLDATPGVDCTADAIDLATNPELPVVCVDWCDAEAHCKSLGKQLCGAIGGGPDAYDDGVKENDPTKSQWYLACAGEDGHAYPYGDAYVRGACRDKTNALTDSGLAAANVGATIGCHGPIGTAAAAVFDLSGNVAEWVDACEPGTSSPQLQTCTARGGWFKVEDDMETGPNGFLGCPILVDASLKAPREHFDDHIGFRCCLAP